MVTFRQPSYRVMEDSGSVTVMILLSQSLPVPFQVEINTIDVTAKSNNRKLLILFICMYVCMWLQISLITLEA